jgi:cell division protein FtsW (lipid II flippase)
MNAALGSQVKSFEDATKGRFGMWWLQIDPLLLLATLGLIGFGAYVVGTATHGDIPGNPDYYLSRQIAYGVVGLLLMLVLARFDYSRRRE